MQGWKLPSKTWLVICLAHACCQHRLSATSTGSDVLLYGLNTKAREAWGDHLHFLCNLDLIKRGRFLTHSSFPSSEIKATDFRAKIELNPIDSCLFRYASVRPEVSGFRGVEAASGGEGVGIGKGEMIKVVLSQGRERDE